MAATSLFRTDGNSVQDEERHLNDAIVNAAISRSFEEYLEIVYRFYSEQVVVTSESTRAPVRGKHALRSFVGRNRD
jgi:hypothetical protein